MAGMNRRNISGFLVLTAATLLLAACGGGSGGSNSGTGTSSVEGNITAFSVAMIDQQTERSNVSMMADILSGLLPVTTVHADGGVDGVLVEMDEMRATSDVNGYFRFDGVSPGTHQISFSKQNQVVRTSVTVGDNEMVTMQNIRMNGSQVHVQEMRHTPMSGGMPETPGTPGWM